MVGERCVRLGLAGVVVLVFVLLVAMQPSLGQTVPEFVDVPEGHLAEDAIMWAAETGINVGVGNNLFGMGETASSSGGCSLVDCRGRGGCASCVVVVA